MKGLALALIVFTIGFLIHLPYRKKSKLGFFHFLWGFLMISTFIFRVRTTFELQAKPLDTAGIFRFSIILIVFAFTFSYTSLKNFKGVLYKKDYFLFAFLIYLGLAFFSSLYSPMPKLSLYKSFELLTEFLLLIVIIKERNVKNLIPLFDINYALLLFLAISAWFWVPIKPEAAYIKKGLFNFILRGAFPLQDADMVTVHAAILAIASYIRGKLFPKKRIYKFLFLFSLITMIFGQARTSISGFLIALLLLFYLLRQKRKLFFSIIFALLIVNYDLTFSYIQKYFLKGTKPEIVYKIGGRLKLWKIGFEYFKQSPILGHGFATGGRVAVMTFRKELISIFNTFLEIGINLGIIGFLSFIFYFLGPAIQLLKYFVKNRRILLKRDLIISSLILEALGIWIILAFRASTSMALGEHSTTMMVFMPILGLAQILYYKRHSNEK